MYSNNITRVIHQLIYNCLSCSFTNK